MLRLDQKAARRTRRSRITLLKITADYVLKNTHAQHAAITWAKSQGHRPLVARVRHLNDKRNPDLAARLANLGIPRFRRPVSQSTSSDDVEK